MKLRTLSRMVTVAILAAGVAACGGGKTTTTTTTNTAEQAAGGMKNAASGVLNNGAQVPVGAKAPVNINCGAVKPVWVNLSSKAYHEPDDPWYGRTKHGQYMCPSQAAAQGFHPAGQRHKGMNSSMHKKSSAGEAPNTYETP